MNKFNKLKYQREYRKKTNNACTDKYEKTLKGFLMRKYRNMKSRVIGIQKLKYHLYAGLSILSKNDFYKWSIENKQLSELYKNWKNNNFDIKLCPSVNRIDPKKGYELSNMEWITHSENSRLGAINRKVKI